MALGPYAVSNYYMETKMGQRTAMNNARQVILDVAKEFEAISGRKYGFFEEYRLEDADYAVLIIGSAAGTCKDAIDALRSKGIKAGLLKLRVFRPFPAKEIAAALSHCKAAAIMDRSDSFNGNGGPLGAEVSQALYNAHSSVLTVNYIYGLGGRDIRVEDFIDIYSRLQTIAETGTITDQYDYIGLRK